MKKMILAVENKTLYCLLKDGEKSIACANAVIERGYMVLLNVAVGESYRGREYGRKLCETMLMASKEAGSHTAYLQVVDSYNVAVNLYTSLGYKR